MKPKIKALIILGIFLSIIIFPTALAEEESTNHSHAVPNATAIPTPTPTLVPTPTSTLAPTLETTSTPMPTSIDLSPQKSKSFFPDWLFITIMVILVLLLVMAIIKHKYNRYR